MLNSANDAIFHSIVEMFENNWKARESTIEVLWDYYAGRQKKHIPRFVDESDSDYEKRTSAAYIENHCSLSVDIPVARIYGTSDGKESISRRADEENANEFLHDNIYKNNDMLLYGIAVGQTMGVTGNAVTYLQPWDKLTNRPLDIYNQSSLYKEKNGTIKYHVLPSSTTVPMPDDNDATALGGLVRRYISTRATGFEVVDKLKRLSGHGGVNGEGIEYIDDDLWLKWEREINTKNMGQALAQGIDDFELVPVFNGTNENLYNRIGIAFVNSKNVGLSGFVDGESDLRDVLPLQDDLNENGTDTRSIVRNHAFPIVKALNGAQLPKFGSWGLGRVWQFERDQDAQVLQWDSNMEASQARTEDTRKQIALISGTSLLSRGNFESIGQIRSGPALKVLFAPDVLKLSLKIPYIIASEKQLIKSTLMMWEWMMGKSPANIPNQIFKSYDSNITIPKDIIGFDDLTKAQTDQINLEIGLEELEDILASKHPEMSESDINSLATTIKEGVEENRNNKNVQSPGQKEIEQAQGA